MIFRRDFHAEGATAYIAYITIPRTRRPRRKAEYDDENEDEDDFQGLLWNSAKLSGLSAGQHEPHNKRRKA
jgi:hypothetical protein